MKSNNKILRISLWLLSGIVVVFTVAVVILLNMDWNRAKPWLNERASEALGRPFSIRGNLALSWEKQLSGPETATGWRGKIPWPHLQAQDIHIGQPPDGQDAKDAASKATAKVTEKVTEKNNVKPVAVTPVEEDMAQINEVSFSLNPLALLDKRLEVPLLRFQDSSLSLQRFADGSNNWTFKKSTSASPWRLELRRVVLAKGKLHYVDAIRHADINVDIESLATEANYGISWKLQGKLYGEAVTGSGKAGAILSLQHQTQPFPIMAQVQMGQTKVSVEGSVTKPSELAAVDMQLQITGNSMARLYPLTGLVLPETPAYSTAGRLSATLGKIDNHWKYEKFTGKVGTSDLAGSLDYQTRRADKQRPLLQGNMSSQVLQSADLGPLVGADSNASKAKRGMAAVQPTDKILPVENFRTERWRSIDADVNLSANKLIRQKELPIHKLQTRLILKDGVITMQPLSFELAGGQLQAFITLDGSGGAKNKVNEEDSEETKAHAIRAKMRLTARHIQLQKFIPTLAASKLTVGEINADGNLTATGNSVAVLLGSSNGELSSMIDHGSVSKLLLEEMGLNIGNIILTRLSGDKQVKLNCMLADFAVTDGQMNARSFLIDTDEALIDISGSVNLQKEDLNLTIKPNSKGLRVFSLRAPLYVRGSFLHPQVSVDKGVMALRAGGAIGLALLTPFAALLPLVSAGPDQPSGCEALLKTAKK
ncbi:AsmA family protein [Undibacterium sp. TC4M20W]|uniref:AsmA family protein n=1 Tax=Undibacterium sp. TC4M20W TaxID=3413052 RepID=UPI003BF2DC9A